MGSIRRETVPLVKKRSCPKKTWRDAAPPANRPPQAPIAQLDRALPSEGRGQRFESSWVRQSNPQQGRASTIASLTFQKQFRHCINDGSRIKAVGVVQID